MNTQKAPKKNKGLEPEKGSFQIPVPDPWDERYIYLHEWLFFLMVNEGKYTSPMDLMGNGISFFARGPFYRFQLVFGGVAL